MDDIAEESAILTPGEVEGHVHNLHYAAGVGDRHGLEVAMQQTEDINLLDVYGRTALVYAVVADKMNCAEMLISAGVDINLPDNEGRSALHWACFHNKPRMAKLLLQCGADPSQADNEARNCLHHACTAKSLKCFTLVQNVLQNNDLLLAMDQWGMTCVHWACQAGALDILKILLGKLHVPFLMADYGGKTPLHWACNGESHKLVQYIVSMLKGQKLLTENGAVVPMGAINAEDEDGRTALHIAVGSGRPKNVSSLAAIPQLIFNIQDSEGRTPLHWASHNSDKSLAALLLQKGGPGQFFSFDKRGVSALHYAVHEGHCNTAVAMLSHKDITDIPDSAGRTAFMVAAIKGDVKMAKALAATGKADIKARDAEGNTALHMAAYFGFDEFVSFLIKKGCPADDCDDRNISALFHATEAGHTKCVEILVKNGANVNFRDSDGRTLLHWAAVSGHAEVIRVLLEKSSLDVDSTDRDLRTPLHNSVFVESIECVSVLLEHNANPDEQDSMGIAALHWAVSKENIAICQMLIEHQADPSITEFHEDRYTPVDYAMMAENQVIEDYLRENNGVSVEELKDESARYLQAWWMGHRARISLIGLLHNQLKDHVQAKEDVVPTHKFVGRRPTRDAMKAGFRLSAGDVQLRDNIDDDDDMEEDEAQARIINRKLSMNLPSINGGKGKQSPKKVKGAVVSLPSISEPSPSPPPQRRRRKIVTKSTQEDEKIPVDGSQLQHRRASVEMYQTISQRRVQGERNRVATIRQKIEAARVIQRAFRRWMSSVQHAPKKPMAAQRAKPRNRRRKKPYEGTIHIDIDPNNKEQQVAALTIQLAWRQYMTDKTAMESGKNEPRRRSEQQAAVYLSEVPVLQWKPSLAPVVRPIEFRYIPSAANTSYHMAMSTYTKPFADIQQQRFQKAQSTLLQKEEAAQKRILETEHKLRSLASLSMRPANYDITNRNVSHFDPSSTQTILTSSPVPSKLPEEKVENFYAQYDDDYGDDDLDGDHGASFQEEWYHDEEDFSQFKAQLHSHHQAQKQTGQQRAKVDPYAIMKNYHAQRGGVNDSPSEESINSLRQHVPPKRKPHAGMKLPRLSKA